MQKLSNIKWFLVVLLSVLAIIFSILLILKHGKTEDLNAWDLSNFVESIELTDAKGSPIDLTNVPINKTMYIKLRFKEVMSKQMLFYENKENASDESNGFLLYQLPAFFSVTPTSKPAPILGQGNITLGYYEITSSGLIKVKYLDVKRDGTATEQGLSFNEFYNDTDLFLAFGVSIPMVYETPVSIFVGNAKSLVIKSYDPTQDESDDTIGNSLADPEEEEFQFIGGDIEEDIRVSGTKQGKVLKLVNGLPIVEYFGQDKYTEIKDLLGFHVYKADADGSAILEKNRITIEPLTLNAIGEIILPSTCTSAQGWYAIVEDIDGNMDSHLPLGSHFLPPVIQYYYISSHGLTSQVENDNTNAIYKVENTGNVNAQHDIKFSFPCGCEIVGDKPKERIPAGIYPGLPNGYEGQAGQRFSTEIFFTKVVGSSTNYFSLCADMGAHHVIGQYIFDQFNHGFTDDELYYLMAAFDYINSFYYAKYGTTLNTVLDGQGDFYLPRIAAQLVLWNLIFRANDSAGYADFWEHPDSCVLGKNEFGQNKTWYEIQQEYGKHGGLWVEDTGMNRNGTSTDPSLTAELNNMVRDLLSNPQKYVDIYNNKERTYNEDYVTGVLYIKGNGCDDYGNSGLSDFNQQRQLIVQFGKGTTFRNIIHPIDGRISLYGEKIIQGEGAQLVDKTFHFKLERVYGNPCDYPGVTPSGYTAPVPWEPSVIKFNGEGWGDVYSPNGTSLNGKQIIATSDGAGQFFFEPISFTQGGYDFKITEVNAQDANGLWYFDPYLTDGWNYDPRVYYVVVQANGGWVEGTYINLPQITKIMDQQGNVILDKYNKLDIGCIKFTNIYTPEKAPLQIEINKQIIGKNGSIVPSSESTKEFKVNVYHFTGAGVIPKQKDLIQQCTISENTPAVLSLGDKCPGTYVYCFTEVNEESNAEMLGYEFDKSIVWVTYHVTDPLANGHCVAEVIEILRANNGVPQSKESGSELIKFTNVFTLYSTVFPSVGGFGVTLIYAVGSAGIILIMVVSIGHVSRKRKDTLQNKHSNKSH